MSWVGRWTDCSRGGRLEQLHEVPGWVLDQELVATSPGHTLTAKRHSLRPETALEFIEVVDLDLKSVPSTWLGVAARRARSAGPRFVEQKSTPVSGERSETRTGSHLDLEPERRSR